MRRRSSRLRNSSDPVPPKSEELGTLEWKSTVSPSCQGCPKGQPRLKDEDYYDRQSYSIVLPPEGRIRNIKLLTPVTNAQQGSFNNRESPKKC
jgi:hypothetical protein